MTFGELAQTSGRLAARLAAEISPGDRVALLAGNEPAFVQAYLATLAAGGVSVPLNGTSPSLEIARELGMVEPALVIASPAFSDLARRACGQREPAIPLLVHDPD